MSHFDCLNTTVLKISSTAVFPTLGRTNKYYKEGGSRLKTEWTLVLADICSTGHTYSLNSLHISFLTHLMYFPSRPSVWKHWPEQVRSSESKSPWRLRYITYMLPPSTQTQHTLPIIVVNTKSFTHLSISLGLRTGCLIKLCFLRSFETS